MQNCNSIHFAPNLVCEEKCIKFELLLQRQKNHSKAFSHAWKNHFESLLNDLPKKKVYDRATPKSSGTSEKRSERLGSSLFIITQTWPLTRKISWNELIRRIETQWRSYQIKTSDTKSLHTVRKSQIVSKNSIFRKITKLWIWIFVPKMNDFLVIMIRWFLLEFEFSRQKLSKFNIFNYCWFCTYIKSRFLARKFKLSR